MVGEILRGIFDWSEVWALLIPLTILIIRKPKGEWVTPVKWYLVIALILNLAIDFMWYINKYHLYRHFGYTKTWNNNVLYNLQSIVRLLTFTWFFTRLKKGDSRFVRVLQIAFLVEIPILFYFNNFLKINSYLLASEAGLLLTCCLWFTVKMIREDNFSSPGTNPSYWVVGGLTVYTAVNFFIFLFYNYLMNYYRTYSVTVWDVHNILFILLCLSISFAFYYGSKRK